MARKKATKKKTAPAPAPVIDVFEQEDLDREWKERMRKIEAARVPVEAPELVPEVQDRMIRHRRSAPCPKCGTFPVVCTKRLPGYAAFRCRECGHRWEYRARED